MASKERVFVLILVLTTAALLPAAVTDDEVNLEADGGGGDTVLVGAPATTTQGAGGHPSNRDLYELPPSAEPDEELLVDINLQDNLDANVTTQEPDPLLGMGPPQPPSALTPTHPATQSSPSLTERWGSYSHDLTTVSQDGTLYYDITRAETTELVIGENHQGVKGVTAAAGRQCLVKSLVVETGYRLDPDIAHNCKLENLTLKGAGWVCAEAWEWLEGAAEEVHYELAHCGDVWCQKVDTPFLFKECKLKEGFRGVKRNGIEKCPEVCSKCRWYLAEVGVQRTSVSCNDANLTDSTFPDLPKNITTLHLEGNQLRSTETLLEFLEDQEKMEVLGLTRNNFTTIPYLEESTFPMLKEIFLQNNSIEQIDLEALSNLLKRDQFAISLQGNPLRCGCNIHKFIKVYLHYFGTEKTATFADINKLVCISDTDNETIPIKFLPGEGCEEAPSSEFDYWILLSVLFGFLNLVMIYFIVDLSLILANCGGVKRSQRPLMDYVVCWGKDLLLKVPAFFQGLCREEQEKEEQTLQREDLFRNYNRDSFIRRRTPRPDMD